MWVKIESDDEWQMSLPKMTDIECHKELHKPLGWTIDNSSGEIIETFYSNESNFGFKKFNRKKHLRIVDNLK